MSDHTNNCYSSFAAVALGANIIEKHFVDRKSRPGLDINASIDKKDLKILIDGCNAIFEQSGNKDQMLKEEEQTKKIAFPSIATVKFIKKGERFSYNNIFQKDPGLENLKLKILKKLWEKK